MFLFIMISYIFLIIISLFLLTFFTFYYFGLIIQFYSMFTQSIPYQNNNFINNKIYKKHNKISQISSSNDEFAFTDLLIRKHPFFNPNEQSKFKTESERCQSPQLGKSREVDQDKRQNQQEQKKNSEKEMFQSPKKVFQIKFINDFNKTYLNQSKVFKKNNGMKFKYQNQLINQRKDKQSDYYTPRISIRYNRETFLNDKDLESHTNKEKVQDYINELKIHKVKHQNEMKRQLMQVNQKNQQFLLQNSLQSSYKIKSLILERNPKEDLLTRSKRLMKKMIEVNKYSGNINASRSEYKDKAKDQQEIKLESLRVRTQFKNRFRNDIQLKEAQINKYNSKKIMQLPNQLQYSSRNVQKQLKIEPWIKQNDHFNQNDVINHLTSHEKSLKSNFLININQSKKNNNNQNIHHNNPSQQSTEHCYVPKLNNFHFNHPQSARNSFRNAHSRGQSKKMRNTLENQK